MSNDRSYVEKNARELERLRALVARISDRRSPPRRPPAAHVANHISARGSRPRCYPGEWLAGITPCARRGSVPAGSTSRLIALVLVGPDPHETWKVQQPAVGTSTMLGPASTDTAGRD